MAVILRHNYRFIYFIKASQVNQDVFHFITHILVIGVFVISRLRHVDKEFSRILTIEQHWRLK